MAEKSDILAVRPHRVLLQHRAAMGDCLRYGLEIVGTNATETTGILGASIPQTRSFVVRGSGVTKPKRFWYVQSPHSGIYHRHFGPLAEGEQAACGLRLKPKWLYTVRKPRGSICIRCDAS
jgi:hypothetical protein